jgi:hypothetical protein
VVGPPDDQRQVGGHEGHVHDREDGGGDVAGDLGAAPVDQVPAERAQDRRQQPERQRRRPLQVGPDDQQRPDHEDDRAGRTGGPGPQDRQQLQQGQGDDPDQEGHERRPGQHQGADQDPGQQQAGEDGQRQVAAGPGSPLAPRRPRAGLGGVDRGRLSH